MHSAYVLGPAKRGPPEEMRAVSENQRLSQKDIERLINDNSDESRAEVAEKVANQVDAGLTPEERNLANSILGVMVKDAAVMVRKALSEALSHSENVPHDIAVELARDVDDVALPMLVSSPVLSDDDLIAIVRGGNAAKQVAIAGRASVSEDVASELVDAGNEKATQVLVRNDGAKLNDQIFTSVLDIYGDNDQIKEALVERPELPMDVSERLITMVSGRLKQYLIERHALSERQANILSDDTRERATVDLLEQASQAVDVEKFVLHLKQNKRLTPSLIVRAICTGDVRFFETAMAVLAKVPVKNARLMIHDNGRLGLRAIFNRTGMPLVYFPIFRVAIDVLTETNYDGLAGDKTRFRRRMIERILTQFNEIDPGDIDYLIKVLEGGSMRPMAA